METRPKPDSANGSRGTASPTQGAPGTARPTCEPVLCLLLIAALVFGCASQPPTRTFPAAPELPSRAALPDPLRMQDGRPVTSARQWSQERKPELQALFAHYMYGTIPPKPAHMQTKMIGEHPDFLGGE